MPTPSILHDELVEARLAAEEAIAAAAADAADRLDRRNTLILSLLGLTGVTISGILLLIGESGL